MMDVDLVYTFVNQGDESLNAARHHHSTKDSEKSRTYRMGNARYRDNGEFFYSLQNSRKFLPFIRNIIVFHAGTAPDWLKAQDGIILVNQASVIPDNIYPTFNSDCVESFIHKIPGLSEYYLYSNDDFFFAELHCPSDFFDAEGRTIIGICDRYAGFGYIEGTFRSCEINSLRALHRKLKLGAPLLSAPRTRSDIYHNARQVFRAKWSGRHLLGVTGFKLLNTTTHVTQPFRKSSWDGFIQCFGKEIDILHKSRFRSGKCVALNTMYHHYMRSTGQAVFYIENNHRYFDRSYSIPSRQSFQEDLLRDDSKTTRFCLNDSPVPDENDGWNDYIQNLMTALDALDSRVEHSGPPLQSII